LCALSGNIVDCQIRQPIIHFDLAESGAAGKLAWE
jgi:hypothetical protein